MSVTTMNNTDCKKILFWRLINAVLCNVVSQVFFLLLILVILNFNVNPAVWLQRLFNILTSFSTWTHMFPISILTLAQGIICSKDYIFATTYRTCRFLKFISIFKLRNMGMLILHSVAGCLMVWLYLLLLEGQNELIYKACEDGTCLKEDGFYLLSNGLWIGFFYFVKNFLYSKRNVSFFIIHQGKFVTIKSNISKILHESMSEAIWPTIYFIALYFYEGSYIRDFFVQSLYLSLDEESFSVFSTKLIMYSWIFSTLFIFTILSMKLFFKVLLTEHCQFPVESTYPNVLTLSDSLAVNQIPIVQYLGCLDLYMLSKWDALRRREIFTLSLPGGHPHNWNKLLEGILKMINEFSSELNKCVDTILCPETNVKVKEISKVPVEMNIETTNIFNVQESFVSTSPQYKLRHISLRKLDTPKYPQTVMVDIIKEYFTVTLAEVLKDKMKQFVTLLQKIYIIKYLFGEVPESHIFYLLSTGQHIILCVQGVAQLVSASFTEDTYGVVQKDLPVIITTLIQLKQSLDKLNKISVSRKGSTSDQQELQLRTALRTAVKRALYNICNTFGDFMSQIQLSKDISTQVQSFIMYKEG